VALTLSDSFCVDRYRDEFLDLMRKGTVDLVFANEAELHSLYQTSDFDTALKQLRRDTKLGVVTRSEKGCVVAAKDGVTSRPHSRFRSWSTRQAPAISSPPASCSVWCVMRATRCAAG
jgi:adenosine kinase